MRYRSPVLRRNRSADRRLILVYLGVIGMTTAAIADAERKDVPDKYKWNLADLYPSEAAWTKAKERSRSGCPSSRSTGATSASRPRSCWRRCR